MTLDERAITEASAAELPAIGGELMRLLLLLAARSVMPASAIEADNTEPEAESDLMTPAEVGAALAIAPSMVHRVAALRPGRVRLSYKVIRYRRSFVERLKKRGAA
jgi:hypothetical protein